MITYHSPLPFLYALCSATYVQSRLSVDSQSNISPSPLPTTAGSRDTRTFSTTPLSLGVLVLLTHTLTSAPRAALEQAAQVLDKNRRHRWF
jgi:hypothetical protein